MSALVSIPIKPSKDGDTHIEVNVDFCKADRSGEAGVKMKLYPVRHDGDFVTHTITFGVPSFPRVMIQHMAKNYSAKVQRIRENILDQFELKHGGFYQVAMNQIAERGYELLETRRYP